MNDSYTHDEVFGDLHEHPFSVEEAAEFLDVSETEIYRLMEEKRLNAFPSLTGPVFSSADLKAVKRQQRSS